MIQKAVAELGRRAPLLEGGPVRVLHVGRRPADVERARHHLHGHGARFALDGTLSAGDWIRLAADEPFDVLLIDEGAPDVPAMELLGAARARGLQAPVVLLLREDDERSGFEAMKLGVYDYLIKRGAELARLPLVLENAAGHYRLARERAEFAVLSQFLSAASGSQDLGQVLRQVTRAARDLLKTDRNLVLLLERGEGLVLSAWNGFKGRPRADLRLPADTGVWADVLASGAPQRLDPMTLSGPWAVPPGLAGVESVFAIPLMAKGRPLGILLSASTTPRRFSKTDEALMRALADYAAVAVENARLVEQLFHAERLSTVGRMVASVAHELNNPLAVILGTLDLLGHESMDSRVAERLTRVTRQAQRAVKIVRTLLALSRKRPAQRRAVDLNELLSATLEVMTYDARHAELRIICRFAEDLPAVLADGDQLQQVFTNLLLNAAQAMRGSCDGGTLTISTSLDASGTHVLATVADTGPGIKPEHLPRLFEPFFTTKEEGQGTGLGLAICQRIVENHSGRIVVDSAPGRGARFTVELPVSPEASRPEPVARVETVSDVGQREVLLIEDDPLVGDMMADILALDGHRVDRASNGREALDRVGARPYALIVSDVRMPDLSGPAFYAELKRRDPALLQRVIFVTGDVVSSDTRSFLDETGALYLEKPFAVADFKAAVARVLDAS